MGETLAARLTVPVKPLRDLRVIVELPTAFGSNGGTVLGFEVMLKSTKVKQHLLHAMTCLANLLRSLEH